MAPGPIAPTTAARVPSGVDLVVRPVRSDRAADDLVGSTGGEAFARAAGFTGAVGQTLFVPSATSRGADHLLVGVGASGDVDTARLRAAAGTAARTATRHAKVGVELVDATADDVGVEDAAQAVVEGWVLGAYRFDAHRRTATESKVRSVTLSAGTSRAVKAAVRRGVEVAVAVRATRDLVNEPGGDLVPTDLADRIRVVAAASGLKVRVDGPAAMARKRLGGVLGVAQGATNEPRFVELRYEPAGRAVGHVALVGKGVTFDTGGHSLKTSDGMKGMNADMGGAAAVVGAMSLLRALKAPVKVSGYLPLVENMIGPDAIRVGDVLTMRGGTTVEVLNTDAEGRLILADALRLACEATPDAIIDLATLTGTCMVALGLRTAGLMGRGDALIDRVRDAADEAGEAVWPLPLPEHLRPGLDSDVADLRNIAAGRFGGALTAGLFLRHFVDEDVPWAHLDIAGPAWNPEAPHGEVGKGGTGFAVRLLAHMLATWEPLPSA